MLQKRLSKRSTVEAYAKSTQTTAYEVQELATDLTLILPKSVVQSSKLLYLYIAIL